MGKNGFIEDVFKSFASTVASILMICLVLKYYPDLIPVIKININVENKEFDVKAHLETGYTPLKVEASTDHLSNFKIQVK